MDLNMVTFIRHLKKLGYTQKQIEIITKVNKVTIHRIWHSITYKTIKAEDYCFDQNFENHKVIFDIIFECKEIPGSGSLNDEDKRYIRLLKHCQVDYDRIKSVYEDRTLRELRNIWSYGSDIDIALFNSTLIGIELDDYRKFLAL